MDRGLRADAARALALAAVLGTAWTVRDWSALAALRLPDTDDTMRLVQVRDWLAGQGWSDLTQRRLAGGPPMHWTRLADLGPAALIGGLSPVLGRHGAEVAAIIAWPLLLFAAAILLVQRLARGAGAPAGIAAVVAALAYPVTTVFMPGRIDHHGLQLCLLLGATLALAGPATRARGAALGALTAASLVVGLETAPLLAMLGLIAVVDWVAGTPGARDRLEGLGFGAGVALLLARAGFATQGWDNGLCDGFTAEAWRTALAGSAAAVGLSVLPSRFDVRSRAVAATSAGMAVMGFVASVTPACLSPYGRVDPLLRTEWLSQVGEAQSILSAPPATIIAYLGLAAAGLAAGAWRLRRDPARIPAMLFLLQLGAIGLACIQLRGAYAAALLGVPALAAAIGAARRAGALRLLGAWAASAGILYPIAAQAAGPAPGASGVACGLPPELSRLAPGLVAAPVDLGPDILLDTPHAVVAAPYHRNNGGNRAIFRLLASASQEARLIARDLRLDYLLLCAGPEGGLLAASIGTGPAPAWMTRVPVRSGGAMLFRLHVRDGRSPVRRGAAAGPPSRPRS